MRFHVVLAGTLGMMVIGCSKHKKNDVDTTPPAPPRSDEVKEPVSTKEKRDGSSTKDKELSPAIEKGSDLPINLTLVAPALVGNWTRCERHMRGPVIGVVVNPSLNDPRAVYYYYYYERHSMNLSGDGHLTSAVTRYSNKRFINNSLDVLSDLDRQDDGLSCASGDEQFSVASTYDVLGATALTTLPENAKREYGNEISAVRSDGKDQVWALNYELQKVQILMSNSHQVTAFGQKSFCNFGEADFQNSYQNKTWLDVTSKACSQPFNLDGQEDTVNYGTTKTKFEDVFHSYLSGEGIETMRSGLAIQNMGVNSSTGVANYTGAATKLSK